MGIKRKIFSLFIKKYLNFKNIEIGSNPVFYGMPHLNIARGGKVVIGDNVVLCSTSAGNPLGVNHRIVLSVVFPDAKIIVGNNTGISGAAICAAKSVSIGNDCLLGANITITDYDFHSVKPNGRRYNTNFNDIGCKPVVIEDNVWLGMNTTVLKGVTIGENSIIAAGSVVTKSVPSDCIAGGNPARVIKKLN